MHETVKLSAYDPFVHYLVQNLVNGSAHVYFLTPFKSTLKKHLSKHNLVSLSPNVPAGQSSIHALVELNPYNDGKNGHWFTHDFVLLSSYVSTGLFVTGSV